MGKKRRDMLRAAAREAGIEKPLCAASTSSGNPCQSPPIRGGEVCWHHGGAAPQVRKKAQERLQKGVLPLLGLLYKLASDESVPPAVRLAAIRDWLDRAGITSKIEIEVDVPWKDIISGIVAEVEDESVVRAQHYMDRLPPAPREVEGYVDAEVVEGTEVVKYGPDVNAPRSPGDGGPALVPRPQATGPRIRQANVRAD